MNSLPPLPGRIAITLGFLTGTWTLVDGLHRLITGDFVRFHGRLGPWAALVAKAGINPMELGPVFIVMGITLLVAANLYLFQNREPAWKFLLIMAILTSWYAGLATVFAIVQVGLLLTPSVRQGLQIRSRQPVRRA